MQYGVKVCAYLGNIYICIKFPMAMLSAVTNLFGVCLQLTYGDRPVFGDVHASCNLSCHSNKG